MKLLIIILIIGCIAVGSILLLTSPVNNGKDIIFTISKDAVVVDPTDDLLSKGVIKHAFVFRILWNLHSQGAPVKPGGYNISPSLWAWQIADKLQGKPDFVWVTIGACIRHEQTAEILKEALGWNTDQYNEFISLFTNNKDDFFEGILYPDTYLLPVRETPTEIARRMTARFNEKMAPLLPEFQTQNIKWTTGLKIASLIAREAAGSEDMNLISGIIWNRLTQGIRLEIDATMQYTKGKQDNGSWWGSIDLSEKRSDSPYNTYKYKGLPPTAICSPNIEYIRAVLEPEETDCIFYLHGTDKQIHCSKTYEEHKENIEKYLRY